MIDKETIARKASDIRRITNNDEKNLLLIDPVIAYLNYKQIEFDGNGEGKKYSGYVDHNRKVIAVNSSDSIRRQRFTCAHEIGHIVLHGDDTNYVDYRSNAIDNPDYNAVKESEANYFAACLLMPEDMYKAAYKKCSGDLYSIANEFAVSYEAATHRASSLGLI